MQRLCQYRCEFCGKLFTNPAECKFHESKCNDLSYLAETYQNRLYKYIRLIMSKGLYVSISVYGEHISINIREDFGRPP